MVINSIFLSGWEYNRLLDEDPITSRRNTALPGDILWNGGAQLWLFENVYCTAESLDNERAAGERLGWTTGKIFSEMADERDPWLKPLDWNELSSQTKAAVRSNAAILRKEPGTDVVRWIGDRDVEKLEDTKALLLEPILREKNAVLSVGPNSLRHWQTPASVSHDAEQRQLRRFFKTVDAPLQKINAGLKIIKEPGTTPEQDQVRRDIESKHIDALVAGEGRFSGPEGFTPWYNILQPHRQAYAPNDEPLLADWRKSKDRLKRLREAASKYIWQDLHTRWLPELLEKGKSFNDEFERSLAEALAKPAFANFFGVDSTVFVGGAGLTALAVMALANNTISPSGAVAMAITGGNAALASHRTAISRRLQSPFGRLGLFYQSVKKDLKKHPV